MKHSLSSVICAGIIIICGHFPGFSAWAEDNPDPQPRVITVTGGSVGGTVRLGGSVVPEQIVNLTAQMPGDVSFVAGSEGDAFEQGDALIALDTTSLLAKREQAMSQLANAEAGHRNALVQYNHELRNPNAQANSMLGGAPGLFSMFSDPARSMMGRGSPGMERGSNLYAQGIQVETARNSVDQARAALRELDESLQNAISYAPFDGVILKRMVEQGDIVQPGMPLVSFADVTRLQIRVEVPTRLLRVIRAGGQIQANLDGDPTPVPVLVDRIFPMADAGGHTTTAKFNLPQGTEAHSGMYAEIILPDPSNRISGLPVIPESAIVWRGSLPAVFQVADDGRLKLRLIRIDEYASNGFVSVISGIRTGDTILAEPASNTRVSR
jgi:multidrug efflux pump subunit AcrA (membrane-fusion protein)